MGLLSVAKFLAQHPLSREKPAHALARVVRWQVASRIGLGPTVVPFVEDSRLLVSRGMTGATGNVYVGLHEFDDMAFLLHALRSDDVFLDVGANVGTYTILAGKVVGARCLAMEAVPQTFAGLQDNLRINDLESNVDARCVAVGHIPGRVLFSTDRGPMNSIVDATYRGTTQEVDVVPLDELARDLNPTGIKIDVEGFELQVLMGAKDVLALPSLQLLLLESNGRGEQYGTSESREVQRLVLEAGLNPCLYDARRRVLEPTSTPMANSVYGNFLYVRDLGLVRKRISAARRFAVGAWQI